MSRADEAAPETGWVAPDADAPGRASCRSGRHVAARGALTDAQGVVHGRCRHCGCELRRLPALRRWFVSGLMG